MWFERHKHALVFTGVAFVIIVLSVISGALFFNV